MATGKCRAHRAHGFTLVEVIVVLTIVALTLAVVAPRIPGLFEPSLGSVSRDMQLALRATRTSAVTEHRASLFWVDTENGQYGIDGTVSGTVPARLQVTVAGAELARRGARNGFLFFPDGSSTGGRLTVSDADAGLVLEVDWLTGRVVTAGPGS